MRKILLAAAALLSALIAPGEARAWGPQGHELVCRVAWLDMTETTRAEVNRLLQVDGQFRAFIDSCNHPDNPRQRDDEHFANYPRDQLRVTGPGCPGGGPCVISAIEGDLALLRSPASDAEKGRLLKFIGHWFGDIHQPLHVSFRDDKGGNDLREAGPCTGHLHRVWDSCIIQRRILISSTGTSRGLAEAGDLLHAGISSGERRRWRSAETWRWAAESYRIALAGPTGYCVRKRGECWYSRDQRSFDGHDRRTVTIDEAYLNRGQREVAGRLRRAGVRLAHHLNSIFDPSYDG